MYLPLQKLISNNETSFDKDATPTPFRKKSKSLVKIFSTTAKNNDNHLSWSYLSPNSSITSITVRNNFLAREKAQIAANSAALQLANYFPETDWMEYFRNFPLAITRRASKLFIINSKRTRISRVLENVTRSEFILLPAFSYNRSFVPRYAHISRSNRMCLIHAVDIFSCSFQFANNMWDDCQNISIYKSIKVQIVQYLKAYIKNM